MIQVAPVTTFDLDALFRVSDDDADRLFRGLEILEACYREQQSTIRPTKEDTLAGAPLASNAASPLDVLGFVGEKNRYEDLIN